MSTPENPPAFPVNTANLGGEGAHQPDSGMTLRDYFAAKAMGQLISHKERLMARADYSAVDAEWVVATAAYLQADAMLRARNRAGEEGR